MNFVFKLTADAVFGWRQLRKNKTTSAAAILSLGLALGACTAAFRLIDALFLRPLPISDPQNLYAVFRASGLGRPTDSWEHPRFRRMRAGIKDEADLIAISVPEQTDLALSSAPTPARELEKAYVQYVSGGMFRSFGLHPAAGRLLTDEDDGAPGANPVTVLSYDYWSRRFGRDPKVVGRTIAIALQYGLGSTLFEIVGVAQRGFTGTEPGTETEIFLPAMMHPLANLPVASLFRMFVRLRPGISPALVRDRLDSIVHALSQEDGKTFPYLRDQKLLLERTAAGVSGMQSAYGDALLALGILVGLVLVIACANVANLRSAQAAERGREMALRVSLGARRGRLLQLMLVESGMVGGAAGAVGALVAWRAAPFVVARINPPDTPARLSLTMDWRVFAAGLVLTLIATVLPGLAPALRAAAVRPASALREGGNPRSRTRLMHGLVAVQAAFCFLVLFVSGLLAATFERLTHQPAGFPVDGLFALDTVTSRDEPPSVWRQVTERLRSTPGVESVAVSEWPLLDGNGYRYNHVSVRGGPPSEINVRLLLISPGWIGTMKIPLIKGRDFRAGEAGTAIVNREFAREFFFGQEPVGRTFDASPGGDWGRHFQIVGVAGDTRYRTIRDQILPIAYIPYTVPWHIETFMVRIAPSENTAKSAAVASLLRREVSRARPGFRVTRIRTEAGMLEAQMVRERLLAMLAAFFATVALLLAGIGVYGVLDYSVFRHRREIGIRMALGEPSSAIARRVSFGIGGWLCAGALMGLTIGLTSARYIESLLYQVKLTDLRFLAIPAFALLITAIAAAVAPVLRALRTDPATVLRSE